VHRPPLQHRPQLRRPHRDHRRRARVAGRRPGQRARPQPGDRGAPLLLPLYRGPARSRPPHPHQRRDAHLELPALADRLRGDLGHRGAVARLPAPAPAAGRARLPEARAPLRRDHARLSGGPGGELLRRLGTAAVALPLLVAALFLGPPWLMVGIIAAAVLVGMWEYVEMMAVRGLPVEAATGALGLAAVFTQVAYGWPGFTLWPALGLLAVGSVLWQEGDR